MIDLTGTNPRPPTIHLDQSRPERLCLFRPDGTLATLEQALEEGFTVTREDAPAFLTWAQRHIKAQEVNQC